MFQNSETLPIDLITHFFTIFPKKNSNIEKQSLFQHLEKVNTPKKKLPTNIANVCCCVPKTIEKFTHSTCSICIRTSSSSLCPKRQARFFFGGSRQLYLIGCVGWPHSSAAGVTKCGFGKLPSSSSAKSGLGKCKQKKQIVAGALWITGLHCSIVVVWKADWVL